MKLGGVTKMVIPGKGTVALTPTPSSSERCARCGHLDSDHDGIATFTDPRWTRGPLYEDQRVSCTVDGCECYAYLPPAPTASGDQ